MMDSAKISIRGSTQEYLELADIRDDLVVMVDGSVALILKVAAVNFGLLSEREQEAIVYAYAGMINSLNFTIQIVVRSQKKDISHYLKLLEDEEKKQTNLLLKNQITNYRKFITETVKENKVLDKKFYVVIPFSSLELGVKTTTSSLLGAAKKRERALPLPVEEIIKRAQIALFPKKDHALRELGRLGLSARQMQTAELTELFYEIYNAKLMPHSEPGKEKFDFEQI